LRTNTRTIIRFIRDAKDTTNYYWMSIINLGDL
jgi:hypothetical protein